MNSSKERRIPPSATASATTATSSSFPSGKLGEPLSNMAMLAVLKRKGRGEFTAHGFRSTFRDWAAGCVARQSGCEASGDQDERLSRSTLGRIPRWRASCCFRVPLMAWHAWVTEQETQDEAAL